MNSFLFGVVLGVCATTVLAQNATPAGVVDPDRQSTTNPALADSAIRPLRVHVVRGAEIGGISGLVSGGLIVVAAATMTGQCNTTSSLDFGGCSSGLTRREAARVVAGGAIVGTVVGAILGYTYHTTLEDRREAHCRSRPDACK